jgi:hypothetical protein
METDEKWCIVGEERVSIVWRRVHKLFGSHLIVSCSAVYRVSSEREMARERLSSAADSHSAAQFTVF